jgi:MSHA pilin protein MshD
MIVRRANCFRGSNGLTLAESVVALFVVALMIVSAMRGVGAAARSRLFQKDRAKGMALAEQLMSEVMQQRYVDPGSSPVFGPETGQTRSTYDDVDDYNNLVETPPQDRIGAAVPGCTGWTRSTKVEYMDQGLLGTILNTDTGIKRITVTVTSPTGRVTTLVGVRSSSSEYDHAPATQTTFTTWAGLNLQIGNDQTTRAASGVNLVNQVP